MTPSIKLSGTVVQRPDATVLIAEDDAILRFTLAMELRQSGYRVREAANAAEAETILDTGAAVDLIVTDIEMPGGRDGLSLAKSIRARKPQIGVIVVSGTIPDDSIVGVADAFFGKPYDVRRVISHVKALLERSVARRGRSAQG